MNLGSLLAMARHELRLTRRLVRYWVFVALGSIAFAVLFAYYSLLHGLFSRVSGSVAWLAPRYLIGAFGVWAVLFLTAGAVFLAFDIRARDVRSRIAEVLDTRPFGNLELVFGRALGMLVAALVPITVAVLLVDGVGWFFNETLEPWSMLSLLLFALLPALLLAIALTMLVTLLVRSRLVAAVLVLGGLVGSIFILFRLPLPWALWCDPTGYALAALPSDLAPVLVTTEQFLQRVALVVIAIALLVFAAAVHPRRDGRSRLVRAGGGVALLAVAAVVLGWGMAAQLAGYERLAGWKSVHAKLRDAPVPDVGSLSGALRVVPGRALEARVEITLNAPADSALEELTFTLNPGLELQKATVDEREVPFRQADGLLRLAAPLAAGQRATVTLAYSGEPDGRFAYLDEAIGPTDGSIRDQQSRVILGDEPLVFTSRFVGLMPGTAWLPRPGAFSSGDDPVHRPRDPFDVRLDVTLPEGFLVAGPGRARPLDSGDAGHRTFRFEPGAPVTDVALIAAPYARRAVEIDGVEFAVLVAPGHAHGIDRFADAREAIVAWISERLARARELGMPYPYDGFTVAEIPARLRGYGGGWKMDTTLAQPGLALMRESGLPTAIFDRWLASGSDLADLDEQQRGEKIRDALIRFFQGDLLGGNLLRAAARNPAWYQVAAGGADALPLDDLVEMLSASVLVDDRGFFSPYAFDRNLQQKIQATIVEVAVTGGRLAPSEALARQVLERPNVWERVETTSLAQLEPGDDPATTLSALQLKGRALARMLEMRDGSEGAGKVLGRLVAARRGGRFDRGDLVTASREAGLDWGEPLADWIDRTSLPAFVAGAARITALPAEDGGRPRYQLLLPVRNEGSAPGFVVVRALVEPDQDETAEQAGNPSRRRPESRRSDPVRIPAGAAREIGLVLEKIPVRVDVEPLLSLNRRPFSVRIERPEEAGAEGAGEGTPFVGARETDWAPADRGIVVMDDLDETFAVEEGEPEGLLARLRGGRSRRPDEELDHGLPVLGLADSPASNRWGRVEEPSAWGRYRHTLVLANPGDENTAAVFAGAVPAAGAFRLEIHVPGTEGLPFAARNATRSTWTLAVVEPANGPELTFDAKDAAPGWHDVGRLRLEAGSLRVRLYNATGSRQLLLADALRLVPDRSGGDSPAEESR